MCYQKKAVTINDISGIGKCSITVASPILSSAGIETAVLPTALLSTQTGGFDNFSFFDLTTEMKKIINHWKTLGIKFDAIYSGYLGSIDQICVVDAFIDDFKKENTVVLVDPVMADSGKLYSGFSEQYVEKMRHLCTRSDIVAPNMTEALFLLGKKYEEGPYTENYIRQVLYDLAGMGCKKVVLTGVYFDRLSVGAACYDSQTDTFYISLAPRIDGFYHGTGDVFSSALLAGILNKKTLGQSVDIAVDFTEKSVLRTYNAKTDTRYGVLFEKEIAGFINKLKN